MDWDPPVLGQPVAVRVLQKALAAGRLHHAYRFEGPAGVGKETCALALAQALVCPTGNGCGQCGPCKRAVQVHEGPPSVPQHPDVVLIERGLYPAATLGRSSAETAGIGVEQIRRIVLARADYPPYEAKHLIFIVRGAHELTPGAANALLKTLEEPRPGVHFILLTEQPRRLLDTIRSRTLPIRFGPLADAALERVLAEHGVELGADSLALAGGSVSRAIELADAERVTQRRSFVRSVLSTLRAPDLGAGLELVARETPDRERLRSDLPALQRYFASRARQHVAARRHDHALRCARCYQEVQASLDDLRRSAPPALTLETLVARLRRA